MKVHSIITHPGGAHKDDFLACGLLAHLHGAPIFRRDPSVDELDDASTLIVDIGGRHEPERGNFDHHQFAKDHPPTCSLSLVLLHLGIYEDAKQFCDWLETAEWFDARGPGETAAWLGVEREVIGQLNSPVDMTVLRRFALETELHPGDTLWELACMVGGDLLHHVRTLRERLDFIGAHSELWNLSESGGNCQALFLPRTDPLPTEPSLGMERYVEAIDKTGKIVALVYPDRRGSGYGLSRFRDHPGVDLSWIKDQDDVHFAHARGFVAKTSATKTDRLRELLRLAQVDRGGVS